MSETVGKGVAWIKEGWEMFALHPTMWTYLSGTWFLIAMILVFVPMGGIVWWLVGPAVYAGFLFSASEMKQGRSPEMRHLLAGFRASDKRWAFITLGALTMLGYLVMSLVLSSITGGGGLGPNVEVAGEAVDKGISFAFILSVVLRVVLTLMVTVLLTSGLLFSAPLVMFTNVDGIEALMTSAEKVFEHWRSLLLIGLIYALVAAMAFLVFVLPSLGVMTSVLATLMIGSAVLILAPVSFCATYVSYLALFGTNVAEDAPAAM